AAARQNQHVAVRAGTRETYGGGDLWGGCGALHLDRIDEDRNGAEAALQHVEDVADGGARRRSDDTDAARKPGQRALVLGVEQSFRGKLRLQDLELAAQSPFAGFLDVIQDELIVAPRLVQAHATACLDVHPVFGREARQQVSLPEHGAANLRGLILQREVPVAGGGARQVRHLAFDPERRQAALEQHPSLAIEPRGGVYIPGRRFGRGLGGGQRRGN